MCLAGFQEFYVHSLISTLPLHQVGTIIIPSLQMKKLGILFKVIQPGKEVRIRIQFIWIFSAHAFKCTAPQSLNLNWFHM